MVDLKRMRYLINSIPQARFDVERAFSKASRTTKDFDLMRTGKGSHRTLDDDFAIVDHANDALRQVLDELYSMRKELTPLIDQLDSPNEKAVMRLRYLQGYSPDSIALAMYRCRRQIYRYLISAQNHINELQRGT